MPAGPEDVVLTGEVTGLLDCSLTDTITWNGLSGQGVPVQNGVSVNTDIDYLNGLTNLPLWDIEDNPYGIKVNLVRPAAGGSSKLPIYWDDSNVPGGNVNTMTGCVYPSTPTITGCHDWDDEDAIMFNSWWYYLTVGNFNFNLMVIRTPATPSSPFGPNPVCQGQSNVTYTVLPVQSATKYIWYLPDGTTDTTLTNSTTISFGPAAVSGQISVKGWNADCGYGMVSPVLNITVNPNPVPGIVGPITACQNSNSIFSVTSGLTNYAWSVSGGNIVGPNNASSLNVIWTTAGIQTIDVITTSFTCPNILTTKICWLTPNQYLLLLFPTIAHC
ncbi:MAG: hypothetical protein IPH45_20040 [Bacteroidales bacterium]|nr:hypothetical protein [Bacteroidales bacterium]